jgi:hypothetical protein
VEIGEVEVVGEVEEETEEVTEEAAVVVVVGVEEIEEIVVEGVEATGMATTFLWRQMRRRSATNSCMSSPSVHPFSSTRTNCKRSRTDNVGSWRSTLTTYGTIETTRTL